MITEFYYGSYLRAMKMHHLCGAEENKEQGPGRQASL